MKHLNSCILKGKFEHYTSKQGALPLTFVVINSNCNGEQKFNVKVNGHLADLCLSKMKKGCDVRLVGRLEKSNKTVFINAEHIDFGC